MFSVKNNIKRHVKTKSIIIASVIIAVAVIAVLIISKFGFGNGFTVTYSADSKVAYRTYGTDSLQYTKDGVTYYNEAGTAIWNDSYTMTSPIAVERNDYTAIFETGGRTVKMYNEEGFVYDVQTQDTILSVSVAENGSIGVITNGTSYTVTVYSPSGNMLFQRVEAESGIYPLCCDVSPDGEIIAISYIDTTGVEIKSKIGMFYINSDVGADYTDSMYGAVEKNDEIIFKMYFMGGNNLIAIGDRNITSISAAGVEEGSVEVTNEIMGVGLCGNKIAMIYGEELSDKEGELPGTIVFVSSGGKLSTGDSAEVETDYFVCSDGGIVAGSGTAYYGFSSGGQLMWSVTTTGNITGIYPTSSINKCIYTTRTWSAMANMNNFDPDSYDPYVATNIITDDGQETENKTENISGEENETENENSTSDKNISDERKKRQRKKTMKKPQEQTENNKNETQF